MWCASEPAGQQSWALCTDSILSGKPGPAAVRRAQVLRSHRETLVSVLETFVHDPLCEWAHASGSKRGSEEGINPMARDALATIEGAATSVRMFCRVY